ncbi:MAG: uracil-DNA glycosylase family protein [Caldimonas sp.]
MQRSDRQLAMLREMGVRVWSRASPAVVAPPGAGAARVAAEAGERTGVPVAARPVAPREAREPRATVVGAASRATTPATAAADALVEADWLVVGEPIDPSGAAGDPLGSGDSERLLDNMLAAIRVTRHAPGRSDRACRLTLGGVHGSDLDAAIARVAPRCILALGRAAAFALLGVDEPIGRLRDRVHRRGETPVVVTFGLPYLLRHPADKARAWADLCRAVGALQAN